MHPISENKSSFSRRPIAINFLLWTWSVYTVLERHDKRAWGQNLLSKMIVTAEALMSLSYVSRHSRKNSTQLFHDDHLRQKSHVDYHWKKSLTIFYLRHWRPTEITQLNQVCHSARTQEIINPARGKSDYIRSSHHRQPMKNISGLIIDKVVTDVLSLVWL